MALRYALHAALIACLVWSARLQATEVRLRLGTNSSSDYYGRVEVLHNGTWGTICDDQWDIDDAHVICRQLGFQSALAAPCCSAFGTGSGPMWLDEVMCHGNESDISGCGQITWGAHDCSIYWEVSGVICKPNNYTNELNQMKFRLTGGAVPYAGRVEVFRAGVWGDVLQRDWDPTDGDVLCRELGYQGVLTVVYRAKYVFHSPSIVTWIKQVHCHGNESSMSECGFVMETRQSSYGYDAGVVCRTQNQSALQFRLKNSTARNAGQVEVLIGGIWGSVNHHHWNIINANVFCRQIGYNLGAETAVFDASIVFGLLTGRAKTTQWIYDIDCHGDESSLNQCNYTVLFHPDNGREAGVVCADNGTENKVKLTGSSLPFAGRVTVNYGGVWGTINNNGWDENAANVVCRGLGYSGALYVIPVSSGLFGRGAGPVWISDLKCYGNESSIWACRRSDTFRGDWGHDSDAGVVCKNLTETLQLKIRLGSSAVHYAGRVEIFYLGAWGTLSGKNFTKSVADVVCHQLGYPESLAALQYGAFGSGSGPVWFQGVGCLGNEKDLTQCRLGDLSPVYPTHLDDASVICNPGNITTEDFQVRLVGANHSGRVEVQYKGVWGSVVHVKKPHIFTFGHVICRQLGYPGLAKPIWNAATKYGSGSGPVWMTHVRCYGNESTIGECEYESSFHGRYPEVGVTCNETLIPTMAPSNQSTAATTSSLTTAVIPTMAPSNESTAATTSSLTTAKSSQLWEFVTIGLPIIGGVLLCLVVIICCVRYCRGERQGFDTNSDLLRMGTVKGAVAGNADHSFAFSNLAVENGNAPSFRGLDGESQWCEIPRRKVTLGNKYTSGTLRITFTGRLLTDGGPVECLVKMLRDPSNEDNKADLTNELRTLSCAGSHPNILNLFGACSLKGPLYLVLEYPEEGSLLKYLQEHQMSYDIDGNDSGSSHCSLPRAERFRIALDVARGMAYLAEKKCVHRDLAARNIFLGKNGVAKITNIGISQDIYERQFYEKVSKGKLSARWMAPESLESMNFTTMSDVWSYGILLWEIETGGSIPYSDLTPDELLEKLKAGYRLKKPLKCPGRICDIMTKCCHGNLKERPEFREICIWMEELVTKATAC